MSDCMFAHEITAYIIVFSPTQATLNEDLTLQAHIGSYRMIKTCTTSFSNGALMFTGESDTHY